MTGLGTSWTGGPSLLAGLQSLEVQADALRMAADWLALGYIVGVGTVSVSPTGAVLVHVEPAGTLPPPPVRLRSLWGARDAAVWEIGRPVRLHSGVWAQQIRLRVPVPGLDLTLWCYERIANPRLAVA
ncbi:hypothetical protein [Parafrankia sp. FMc2]|uniref:hypothetical protein n=1 Tax=Parafrankia sp. FMc2 TaxID=3233196 RepID=UPI0034D77B96